MLTSEEPVMKMQSHEGQKQAVESPYTPYIHQTLKKILPNPSEEPLKLPLIPAPIINEKNAQVTLYFLFKAHKSAFNFVYRMVKRWLLPGKTLSLSVVQKFDFCMPKIHPDNLTLCEIVIQCDFRKEAKQVVQNYPVFQKDIAQGLMSPAIAQKMLEMQGLTLDEKSALVHEKISYAAEKFSSIYDMAVFTEMQHLLIASTSEFKLLRQVQHLTKVICLQYLFRKELLEKIKKNPNKRYQKVKVFKASLPSRPIACILVGLNFLRENEFFDQRHLLQAIVASFPGVRFIENSCICSRRGSEPLTTVYLEIEKMSGEPITQQEIKTLQADLSRDLNQHIEDLLPPVFMPRNEEEIMRYILSLSNQIKYVHDLPQMVISFDNQTHTSLNFTVIVVRTLGENPQSIQELFANGNTFMEYTHDRTRRVGMLRKKYIKEATVFRLKFSKNNFLRTDHSIDLSKARQAVVLELTRLLGPIRDFNGGMISKQTELLTILKNLLKQEGIRFQDWLLENFFYALDPPAMKAVIDPKCLKILFAMVLGALNQKEAKAGEGSFRMSTSEDAVYIMMSTPNPSLKDQLEPALQKMKLPPVSLMSSFIRVQDIHCLGYIFISADSLERERFAQNIVAAAVPLLSR